MNSPRRLLPPGHRISCRAFIILSENYLEIAVTMSGIF